nr:EOG090X0DUJ [Macrothrix elegans]
MAEYSGFRPGKLKIKGHKDLKPHKKHKSKKREHEEKAAEEIDKVDMAKHGGWWNIQEFKQISGTIAIEFGERCYIKALDNGLFVLGPPHDEGDPPSPEEIFTAFPVGETKITLKSGYGKYLGIDKNSVVVGRSDAVSALEQWEPVFQDGKLALLAANSKFVSISPDDDSVYAHSMTAGENEILKLRSNRDRETEQETKRKKIPEEERGSVDQIEINYVKQFQKFQDKKMRICSEGREVLESAKSEGYLHEALLDRRSKMKADRYCK